MSKPPYNISSLRQSMAALSAGPRRAPLYRSMQVPRPVGWQHRGPSPSARTDAASRPTTPAGCRDGHAEHRQPTASAEPADLQPAPAASPPRRRAAHHDQPPAGQPSDQDAGQTASRAPNRRQIPPTARNHTSTHNHAVIHRLHTRLRLLHRRAKQPFTKDFDDSAKTSPQTLTQCDV